MNTRVSLTVFSPQAELSSVLSTPPSSQAFCKQHSIMQAAAGNEHTSVLCSDGSVYCCGYNDSGQCGQGHTGRVPTLRRIDAFDGKQVVMIQSANGCEHLAAVTEDGELYTCGKKSFA